MSQTQLTLIKINAFDLLALQKLQKVSSESSNKLVNNGGSGGLDFKGIIDSACELVIADSQLDFGLLLHGKLFTEEVNKNFRGFSCISAVNHIKGDG